MLTYFAGIATGVVLTVGTILGFFWTCSRTVTPNNVREDRE